MGALRSTDIKDIKDKDDHYHFTFRLYDYETVLPKSDINHFTDSRMYERLTYAYVRRYLGQDEPDFGFLDDCQFYKEGCLPFFDYNKYHLLVPKNVEQVSSFVNGENSFEVILEDMGGMVRLVIIIVENRLKRSEKLKKIKDKICIL